VTSRVDRYLAHLDALSGGAEPELCISVRSKDPSCAIVAGNVAQRLAGLFPIHDVERQYIREHGLDPFIQFDWDCYDVARPSAV